MLLTIPYICVQKERQSNKTDDRHLCRIHKAGKTETVIPSAGRKSTFTGVGFAPIGADFILWTDCDGWDPCKCTLIVALSTFCNSHRCQWRGHMFIALYGDCGGHLYSDTQGSHSWDPQLSHIYGISCPKMFNSKLKSNSWCHVH